MLRWYPISTGRRVDAVVVMSLGLGLAVLVTITQIDGNLRRQFLARCRTARRRSISSIFRPPSRRFERSQADRAAIDRRGCAMLRGRSSQPRRPAKTSAVTRRRMVLQSDRGLTIPANPQGLQVVEGNGGTPIMTARRWCRWRKNRRRAQPWIGDQIVVNVLGAIFRPPSAICATSMAGPRIFRAGILTNGSRVPHYHIATLTETHPTRRRRPDRQSVADAFPMVTSVRVREALETIGTVVPTWCWRSAASASRDFRHLVLGGALAAGHAIGLRP